MQEVSRRVKALGEELERRRGRARRRRSARCPTRRTRARPTRTRRCARSARRARPAATTWSWRAPLIDMEAGARLAGSRFAYLRGDLVLLELALVRWALELLGERGFEPVVPPVLVREEALFGTGFLPDTEQQIYRLADDALYLAGTSEVRARLAARRRDARRASSCRCATPASRPASGARPAPRGATRAASSACTSSTRSRCSASCEPEDVAGRARAAAGDRGGDPAGARDPLPRGQHRGRRPRHLGGQEVRLRGVAARPAALPRGDLDLEHDRLPVAPARHPLPAGGRRRPAPRRTRSTAPR